MPYTTSRIFFKSSSVLISSGFLSFRQRLILGKRKATPLLWRLLAAIPSNAISKTSSGFTVLTGSNFSIEFLFSNAPTSLNSLMALSTGATDQYKNDQACNKVRCL
jgi:hypothetical protein